MRILLLLFTFTFAFAISVCAQVPSNCTQALVGITDTWSSSKVTLTLYQKKAGQWQPVNQAWQGRLGKSGSAWGLGIHPLIQSKAPIKKEGDWRAPAGIFKIGGAYGYAASIQKQPSMTYRDITTKDLWVEDQHSTSYNRHVILDHQPTTKWEKNAQMRQNDHAHSLKLYIAHNDAMLGGKPIPGRGSAIFFHIWRGGGSRPTAGCTTMHETQLKKLISLIKPSQNPVYILLPQTEYKHLKKSWKLP